MTSMAERALPIAVSLEGDWWVAALKAVSGRDGAVVAELGTGSTTRELPVELASRAVSELDPELVDAAIHGETRKTVLDAAASNSGQLRPRVRTGPPMYVGTFDQVAAKLQKRKSLKPADVIAGISSRPEEEHADLLHLTARKIPRGQRSLVLTAALEGTLAVSGPVAARALGGKDARNQRTPTSCILDAWGVAEGDGRDDILLKLGHVCAELGWDVPAVPSSAGLARAASSWDPAIRHHALNSAAQAGAPWAELAPLAERAPAATILGALTGPECTTETALELLNMLPNDQMVNVGPYQAVRIMNDLGEHLSEAQLVGLIQSFAKDAWGYRYLIGILDEKSDSVVNASVLRRALRQIDPEVTSDLYGYINRLLDGRVEWGRVQTRGWSGTRVPSFRGPRVGALLAAAAGQPRWQQLYESIPKHSAAAAAVGELSVAALERHHVTPESGGVTTFFSMLGDWEGTLDELAASCAALHSDDITL